MFADADLDAAVEGAMTAKMRNMGEACTAANRFLVHRSVAGAFADKLAERMAALRVGRGTDDGVQVGPLVDAKSREKVVELVGDAVERGATVRVGGDAVDGPGWFYRPTVLTDVPLEARLTKEEIFGPVAPISVFDTDDEAVAAANDTEFGLVSYLFTENLNAGAAGERGSGVRHGRAQHRPRQQPRRAVRRASSSPGWAARAARSASTSTSRRSTSPSA